MYLKTLNEQECCGCTACSTVCPKNIVKMMAHRDGFMFPYITQTEQCISCGLCERACPMASFQKSECISSCYYGWCEDPKLRESSTSGGAYSAIAIACKRTGYDVVYGVAFDAEGVLVHIGVPIDDYSLLRGTKYVQSNLNDCFLRISNELGNGKKVLFIGTPCQVEGLLHVVKNKDTLLTVSLICHNTASPAAFKKYYDQMKSKKQLSQILFRDKSNPNSGKGVTTLVFSDGTKQSETENPYTIAFGLGLMSRKSCNVCPFTTINRNSDFTIGDFWGIEDMLPELKNECSKGVSLLIAHSTKAKKMIPLLKEFMMLSEVPIEYAINEKQPQLSYPTKVNPRRDAFLNKILNSNSDFSQAAKWEITLWRMKDWIRRHLHINLE